MQVVPLFTGVVIFQQRKPDISDSFSYSDMIVVLFSFLGFSSLPLFSFRSKCGSCLFSFQFPPNPKFGAGPWQGKRKVVYRLHIHDLLSVITSALRPEVRYSISSSCLAACFAQETQPEHSFPVSWRQRKRRQDFSLSALKIGARDSSLGRRWPIDGHSEYLLGRIDMQRHSSILYAHMIAI